MLGFLFGLLGSAPAALALDPDKPLGQYAVEVFPARAGLPGTWVRDLAQTRDGYLWIATFGGAARYDGARMWALSAAPPFENLRDVMALGVAPDDTLWVIPSGGPPVCVRDGRAGPCFPPDVTLSRDERLVDVATTAQGTWLLARKRLWWFSEAGLVAVPAPAFSRGLVVHADRKGRVWVGTTAGLLVGDQHGVSVFAPDKASAKALLTPVTAILELPEGQLWFGTHAGLVLLEGASSRLYVAGEGLPPGRITHLARDGAGSLWVGTTEGLVRKRGEHFESFAVADGLPHREVTAVLEDQEGSLWVGTRVGGIAQFSDRTVEAETGPPSLRGGQWVESVCEDATGAMWFGHRGGAIRWRDGQERLFGTAEGLPSQHVYTFAPSSDGALWIGTSDGVARLRGDRVELSQRTEERVEALFLDSDGSLWMGLVGGVLGRLVGDKLERHLPSEPDRLGNIRSMVRDPQGVLWLAGSRGLGRFVGGRVVVDEPHVRAIRSQHLDAEGRLWLSTSRGLLSIVEGRRRFVPFVPGSFGGHLFQVITDAEGNLWVGSSVGLLRIDKEQLDAVASGRRAEVHPLALDVTDRRRDVTAMSTRQPSTWRDRSGRLWFASDQGVLSVDPAKLRLNSRPPTVRIDEAMVDGRAVSRGKIALLPPGPGNLAFRFSAITLLEPHKSLHRYRLEGFDKAWVDAGSRRVAYYTNIPPGHYRFRVIGSNADGVWSRQGDVVEFRLAPHFYDTAWFYAGLGALFLGAIAAAYRVRVRSLRRQYLAVFAERTRVARELHDTLLQGMSAVGLQIRAIRRRLSAGAPEAAGALESVERLVSSSLAETRRFLGDLREQPAGGGDLRVALERMLGRMLQGRTETFTLEVVGEPLLLPDDVKGTLFRIAQEAVNNALRHAGATHLHIRIEYDPETVRMTVRDNGKGFDESSAMGPTQGHFGLLGMRERAASIGTLTIRTAPGEGTAVEILTGPLKKTET